MYLLKYSGRFKKDFKKLKRGGSFDVETFMEVVDTLVNGKTLDKRFRNHKLKGEFDDCYECHIQPDVLLIYKIDKQKSLVYLLRIGSHSDLF